MEKHFRVKSEDLEALNRIAPEIIGFCKKSKIITLQGDLGAGKTTLVKALCKHLGILDDITSPTFTFVNEYSTNTGVLVFHMDMYRIDKEEDASSIGLRNYFDQQTWCFIEWPENIVSFLPDSFVSLKIESDPETHDRTILMRQAGEGVPN